MSISNYFKNISQRLNNESGEIREFFSSHRPTAGANREDLVAQFLTQHLPKRYSVSNGLIFSSEGEFSNQADVLICDKMNNAPLFGDRKEPIWLVEAVYGLIEVKTTLTPTTFADSIKKCKNFKKLRRNYSDRIIERIRDSLFILWAFEGPSPETFKKTIEETYKDLTIEQRPDLIIVPEKYVVISGKYQETARIGQPTSPARSQIEKVPNFEKVFLHNGFELAVLNEHSLLAFIVWLSSWLHQSGERYAPLTSYLPSILESKNEYKIIT